MRTRRIIVSLLFLLVAASLLPGLSGVRFDNYHWLPADHPVRIAKQYLDQEFQQGEDLVIGIKMRQDYFSQDVLDELHSVYETLTANPLIKQVQSPLHASLAIKDKEGALSITDYWDALERGLIANLEDYRQHLIKSDYWGQLIALDAASLAMIVKTDIDFGATEDKYETRQAVIDFAGDTLDKTSYLNDYVLSGETELIHQLDKRSRENLLRLLPLSIFITFFLLWLFLRRLFMSMAALLAALLTLLVTLNVNIFNGHALNVVSLSLPILIIVISLADSVHILARWRYLAFVPSFRKRLARTFKETWLPCLATSVTTAMGFGVFYISELLPLKQFGLDAFISILLAYPMILLSIFGFLYAWGALGKRAESKQARKKALKSTGSAKKQRTGPPASIVSRCTAGLQSVALPVVIIFLVGAVLIISRLQYAYTETNFLDAFFSKTDKVYTAFLFADENLGGSGAVDIILQREDRDFTDIKLFHRVRDFAARLAEHPQVNYVNSYLLPIRLVHKEFSEEAGDLPDDQTQLAQEILFLEFSRSDTTNDVLSPYTDFTYANSRLRLQTPNLNSVEVKDLLKEHINPLLETQMPGKSLLTGTSYYFQALSDYVLRTQLESFLICFILVWLLFVMLFGPINGGIALITNILPVGLSLGSIVMLGLPFDFATVLVASISLGLCIDDTIHYLHYYNLLNKKGKRAGAASVLPQVSDVLARPIFLTSLLLLIGFGVFITADLVVMLRFGLFTGLAIVGSLFSVFVFLPCLLTLSDKLSRRART